MQIYWTIISNSIPMMIGAIFQMMIQNMNMHYSTNKQMMTGIGIATILNHCVGGAVIQGFRMGFSGLTSRAFTANNKSKYKRFFVQGLTNLAILLVLFIVLAFGSYNIVSLSGQSKIIANYAYKTMLSHLPGFCFFYISDFLWGFLNSQKVFKPVMYIFLTGLGLHFILSITISKNYGFNGIILSTNITFATVLLLSLYSAKKYVIWELSLDLFKVDNPYHQYYNFIKESFFIALPYAMSMFIFEFMTLHLGSFKINSQTAANVALTNLEYLMIAPHIGYTTYGFTKVNHYIGQNRSDKIKEIIKSSILISIFTYYFIIALTLIFKHQLAAYYFSSQQMHKYFFSVLSLFTIRGWIQALRINGKMFLRAMGLGTKLSIICILCYYGIGMPTMILYCKQLQNKVLAVWLGFFTSQIIMVLIFFYISQSLNIDKATSQLYEKVKQQQSKDQQFGQV